MPVPLTPLGVAVDGIRHQLRNKVRDSLEDSRPVLQDLRTTNERAGSMEGLRTGVVLGEQSCHGFRVMGVLCIEKPLQHRRHINFEHSLQPRIIRRGRASGWESARADIPYRYPPDRWSWRSC